MKHHYSKRLIAGVLLYSHILTSCLNFNVNTNKQSFQELKTAAKPNPSLVTASTPVDELATRPKEVNLDLSVFTNQEILSQVGIPHLLSENTSSRANTHLLTRTVKAKSGPKLSIPSAPSQEAKLIGLGS